MLEVRNLHATVDGKEILRGINLTVRAGEVHAIMGPNGSGKSTFASVLAGNEKYEVTEGEVLFDGKDLLSMSIEERGRAGLFLGFQYPVEIPGVSMANFLKYALNEKRKYQGLEPLSSAEFLRMMREKAKIVEIDSKLTSRSVNEGFSGGEKKKNEIFQMAMFEPKLAILDETDKRLSPGNTVSCRILIDKLDDVLFIPVDALMTEGGTNFVYKKRASGYERVDVEVGQHNNDYVVITNGLSENDEVALIDPFAIEEETDEQTSQGE